MSERKLLFSDDIWHYYDDFTLGGHSEHRWKIKDGSIYWWSTIENEWQLDYINVQVAYQKYLMGLITNE